MATNASVVIIDLEDAVAPENKDAKRQRVAQLTQDVSQSRTFGFGAKLCIHPSQVESVNAGYAPDAAEITWAEKVIAAVKDKGTGAIAVDGKQIDKPLFVRAQKIMASIVYLQAADAA